MGKSRRRFSDEEDDELVDRLAEEAVKRAFFRATKSTLDKDDDSEKRRVLEKSLLRERMQSGGPGLIRKG